MIKSLQLVFVLLLFGTTSTFAQTTDTAAVSKAAKYTATITARADKIVAKLNITDKAKYKRVLDAVVDQYRAINDLHDSRNAQVADIKKQATDDKAAATAKIKAADDDMEQKTTALHTAYISRLNADLTPDQVDKVKDEMTYNVLSVTYKAYLDEIPTLTDVQKTQIKTWLVEAREHAIDAESSDKKHAVFGKYKGRINNYLSAQGYDMKKQGEEWQKRIKAAQPDKQ